jgi:CHAT domain-containing protein/tetratricopeptide (TPR) repeat protein
MLLGFCNSASIARAQQAGTVDPLFVHRCNVITDSTLAKASKPEQQTFFREHDAQYQAGLRFTEAGRFQEALSTFLDYANTLSRYVAPTHFLYLDVLQRIATVRYQMRDFSQALIDAKSVFRTRQECYGPDDSFTLESVTLIAAIFQSTGQWAQALPLAEIVLDAERRQIAAMPPAKAASPSIHHQLINAEWNVAALQYRLNDLEHARTGALAVIEETKSLDPNDPERYELANTSWYALDRIEHRKGEDQTQALAGLQSSYEGLRALLGPDHPRTFPLLANEGFAAADIDSARGSGILKDYVMRIEGERTRMQLPADRQIFLEGSGNAYQRYAFASAEANQVLDAFYGMELSKARSLRDAFSTRLALVDQVLPRDQALSLEAAESRVSESESRLESVSADPVARVAASRDLDNAKTNYAKIFDAASDSNPRFRIATQSGIITPENAGRILRPDEVFVSYLTERSDSIVMKILVAILEPNGKLTVVDLGDSLGLDFASEAYVVAISRPNGLATAAKEGKDLWTLRGAFFFGKPGQTYPEADLVTDVEQLRASLSEQLLPKPVRDILAPYKHWIVSPGGPLWNIPFETLTDGDGLVIDHRVVRYVHSWTMFTLLSDAASKRKPLPEDVPLMVIGGASYSDYVVPPGTPPTRYPTWLDLPFSTAEINTIAEQYKLKDGVTAFRDKAALRSTVLQLNSSKKLSHVRSVLFSTHGYLDGSNPALSALVLGRPEGGYENDRYVTARELATFDMPADLIVVSSCNSGNGRVAAGEGILGLPYALFAAGATRALVTRWSIFDVGATAHISSDLVTAITSGTAPDDALTQIKREIRRTQPEAYWAPFVLIGH